ncbi:MAG: choline dehydrogenase [Candidatus Acidiferrales bacterium]
MSQDFSSFDYIVVGAGSAGCVLAARLTEDPHTRVLLLEAGGPDSAREVHIPAAFSRLFQGPLDWNYSTEPEPHLHNRRLYWPRGKMLGGSSSLNAMIYVRGARADYDHWRDLGNPGWGFDDVLPYFKKSETNSRSSKDNPDSRRFSGDHGTSGALSVTDARYVNPLTRAFLAAAECLGIPPNEDFNGPAQDGAGLYQVTQRRGRRHSAADAFLRPAMRRPNLSVQMRALATRILIERGRAVGVEYRQGGSLHQARAEREVILAGGTVNSPQLLLLSGIGPAAELARAGVGVVHDLPGVGKNLQDHPMVSTGYLCTKPVSMASAESLPNLLRYLLRKRGPLASNVAEAGVFLRSREGLDRPDLQILFGPAYYVKHGLKRRKDHCFGFGPTVIAPASRGEIGLRSSDPGDAPAIRANYFAEGSDLQTLIEGVRFARRLAETKSFDFYRGAELHPGPSITTDGDIAEFIRNEAETLYHPVGTCKMGADAMAVVDARLRVRGVRALRVADASIMPRIPAGNTNAPAMMIAEKAADMIRDKS